MLIRLQEIVDDRLCYEKVRELRWQEGVTCPHCGSSAHRRHGHHNSTEHRYRIYDWMSGKYELKRVNHGKGEYARDEDKDGKCEIHVNTIEGFWSLLRSWLRPHRGIPQESLPLYLGFFEFVHNVRARGKRLLGALIGQLLAPPRNPS